MSAARSGTEICVFDAYGTLFDFNSAVARHRAVIGPKADALAEMWRAKQIQYTWLRNGMGAYDKFWQVTGEALDHCLAAQGIADASVRDKASRFRQRRISAWFPDNSTSGTLNTAAAAWLSPPAISAGRVYCGKSSSPRLNESSATDCSSPTTPGTSRDTASTITSAGNSPPDTT